MKIQAHICSKGLYFGYHFYIDGQSNPCTGFPSKHRIIQGFFSSIMSHFYGEKNSFIQTNSYLGHISKSKTKSNVTTNQQIKGEKSERWQ